MNSNSKMRWLLQSSGPIKRISPLINNMLTSRDFNVKLIQGSTSTYRGGVYVGMAPKDNSE